MILGEKECDAEIAYYLKHGKMLAIHNKSTPKPAEFDWEKAYEQDSYHCWQGTRIPQWFE